MAMLAEPRRKVRYCINPNGNTWANDSTTYGKKMLEKMGWSHGKGLGANLDGMTSHVRVEHKADQRGVGFKERNDQWTEHEDNFTRLLKNLQSTDGGAATSTTTPASLEEKSKSSKARVHYKKFTRGKDLSRYSAKDLANIFGRASLEKPAVKEEPEEEVVVKKEEEEKSFGVETVQGGSMADYFKKKMKWGGFNARVNPAEDEEDEARPSFGFGFYPPVQEFEEERQRKRRYSRNEDSGVENSDENSDKKTEKKKKKKKKQETGVDNPTFDDSPNGADENLYEVLPFEVKNKKKKKHKKEHQEEQLHGEENPTFGIDETMEVITDEPPVNPYEIIVEENKPKNKKKKKNKCIAEEGISNPTFEQPDEELPKKKKKKHQHDEEPSFEITEELPEEPQEKKMKKKKKQSEDSIEAAATPSLDIAISDLILNVASTPITPKPILHTPQNNRGASAKRRKSVRIDESLNQQRIIPNLQQQEDADDIDIENLLNEGKQILREYIGAPAKAETHQKLPDGRLLLAYKHNELSESVALYDANNSDFAKRGYRQFIKGDIEVDFVGSNLHQVHGYATAFSLKMKPKRQ